MMYNYFNRDEKIPRINSKRQFLKMQVGDVLTFKRFKKNWKGTITDFDEEVNPVITWYNTPITIKQSEFVRFERRFL